ncbi:hypothetical protein EON83_23360 [bacterium]|nr:MAG: hypothetical protein EON83_23360 [bacterium]
MKTWPFLLLLPFGVGAGLCTNSLVQARATVEPTIGSQAQLDDYALKNPSANLDKIGHAFGNSQARLFWNTDLEAAKRQSAREGKPILALRLLGKLSDEYSCANSRFFRVVFYPQSKINQRLRRDFVLYWSSERPVPVVTIDMGDGRILKRTITGNSAHYLLDSNGRPLDVFPGLATPTAFASWLDSSTVLAQNFKALPQGERNKWLANWHSDQLRETIGLTLGKPTPAVLDRQVKREMDFNPLEVNTNVTAISAREASPLAVGKMVVERPMLGALDRLSPRPSISLVDSQNTPPLLDEATVARIHAMNPLLTSPQPLRSPVQNVALTQTQTTQKNTEEARFKTLISAFEDNLRSDTRQNQRFSISLHALFANSHEGTLESLNRRVYDRLFLTPRSDEWLGLTSDTAFSALQNDGITLPTPSTTN